MGHFLLVYLLYSNDGIALKLATTGFIFAHVSLSLSLYSPLHRVYISVSYLLNNSPLTNDSIS